MDKTTLSSIQVSIGTNIKHVMQELNETVQKILFVIDEERRVLGTITDGDIRRGIMGGMMLTDNIDDLMNRSFIFLREGAPDMPDKARELMQHHSIGQIPILGKNNTLVNVILWIDYLNPSEEVSPSCELDSCVVVMAGGQGKRLAPFTNILPKPLLPLGSKPVVQHIMDNLYRDGFRRFILVVNYKKEMVKTYFADANFPYRVDFVEEEDYQGTAGGLSVLKGKVTDTFLVTNCDTILKDNYSDLLRWHDEEDNLLTIVGSHKEITIPYGVIRMSERNFDGIDEKPLFDLFVNTGTYVLEPEILKLIDDRESINMDQLIRRTMNHHKGRVGVYPHLGAWFDMGQWDDYRESAEKIEKLI